MANATLLDKDLFDLTDSELLESFVRNRDESSFAHLLHRHGPMVLRVCRQTLANEADAEDAFQATFLVLVRKAASVRPRNRLGNWLYGVAHTTALKARAMNARRSMKEREAARHPNDETAGDEWQHLHRQLHAELARLPDKYRVVIVLCDLEGVPLKDVARQLGCPIGTVGTRVVRGRLLLGRRLAQRGLTVSASLLAVLLGQGTASASVPDALAESTLSIASHHFGGIERGETSPPTKVATLASFAIEALLLLRLKIAVVIFLVTTTFGFAGVTLGQRLIDRPQGQTRKSGSKDVDTRPDEVRLEGRWAVVSAQWCGQELTSEQLQNLGFVTIEGSSFVSNHSAMGAGSIQVNSKSSPKEIEFHSLTKAPSKTHGPFFDGVGIYQLDGKLLTICLADSRSAATRPKEFRSQSGQHGASLIVLKRKCLPI